MEILRESVTYSLLHLQLLIALVTDQVNDSASSRNWPGGGVYTLVMSNSVLSIVMMMVSSSRWGSFFDVVDSGL